MLALHPGWLVILSIGSCWQHGYKMHFAPSLKSHFLLSNHQNMLGVSKLFFLFGTLEKIVFMTEIAFL